jgi:hypothetical protein
MDDRAAMRVALGALESNNTMEKLMAAKVLRERLAQQEPEPVAWREKMGKWKTRYYDYNEEGRGEPLYTAPLPPPECQTEAEKTAYAFGWWQAWEQKKKWVGLTADEENEIAEDWWKDRLPDIHSVIKAIEAKLKERNNGC